MAKQVDKKKKKGKTPKELMHKHIIDKEDIISEEEFKEMEVGIGVDTAGDPEPLELPGGKNRPKDEDKDPDIVTPWDVIN